MMMDGTGWSCADAFLQTLSNASLAANKPSVVLQGLEDVYSGGRSANALENSVERALTRRDAHGRVLTPKEAFRDLCHQ